MEDIAAIRIALNSLETTLNHLCKMDDLYKVAFSSDREFLAEARNALINIGKTLKEKESNNKQLVA